MRDHSKNEGVLLPGLDGTNPLGFLAGLGALRVLSIQTNGVKLAWKLSGGTWRPELSGVQVGLSDLGAELHTALRDLDQSVWSIDKELPFEAKRLRAEAIKAVTSADRTKRISADMLAALGVECFFDKKTVGKGEKKKGNRIFRA